MPKFYKKSRLEFVRNHWGKDFSDSVQDDLNFPDLEEFFVDMMKRADWILDDQTWNDMEMNRIFCKLDGPIRCRDSRCCIICCVR